MDPRWSYKQSMEAIQKAEKRLYEPPGEYCNCEPECQSNEHQEKVDAAEQANNDAVYEREREKRVFGE